MLGDAWASADGYLSVKLSLSTETLGEHNVMLMFQMPKWGLVIAESFPLSSVSPGKDVPPPLLKVQVLKVVSGLIFPFCSKELRERFPTSHLITTTVSWAQGN